MSKAQELLEVKTIGVRHQSLIANYILKYLEKEGFSRDKKSPLGGQHTTANGTRLQIIEDSSGNKYEVLVNPLKG